MPLWFIAREIKYALLLISSNLITIYTLFKSFGYSHLWFLIPILTFIGYYKSIYKHIHGFKVERKAIRKFKTEVHRKYGDFITNYKMPEGGDIDIYLLRYHIAIDVKSHKSLRNLKKSKHYEKVYKSLERQSKYARFLIIWLPKADGNGYQHIFKIDTSKVYLAQGEGLYKLLDWLIRRRER